MEIVQDFGDEGFMYRSVVVSVSKLLFLSTWIQSQAFTRSHHQRHRSRVPIRPMVMASHLSPRQAEVSMAASGPHHTSNHQLPTSRVSLITVPSVRRLSHHMVPHVVGLADLDPTLEMDVAGSSRRSRRNRRRNQARGSNGGGAARTPRLRRSSTGVNGRQQSSRRASNGGAGPPVPPGGPSGGSRRASTSTSSRPVCSVNYSITKNSRRESKPFHVIVFHLKAMIKRICFITRYAIEGITSSLLNLPKQLPKIIPCFDYLAIYLVSNAENPCVQHFFGCAVCNSTGAFFWASNRFHLCVRIIVLVHHVGNSAQMSFSSANTKFPNRCRTNTFLTRAN